MIARACTVLALLGAALGCSDRATIGGLCLLNCVPSEAGVDACAADGCRDGAVAPEGGADACAAGGCEADAGSRCRAGPFELTRMPTHLMLLVDDSVSVSPWYEILSIGLLDFLQSTEPIGLGIGLQRFDEVCEREPYVTPLVPIAPLMENLSALRQVLPLPGVVSTSTVPALDGAHLYARLWSEAHDAASVSVVLLTDASPGACDGLIGDYEGEAQRIVRAALEAVPPIRTYVVGFSVLPALSAIAIAGGTEPALIDITPSDGEVRAALETVRETSQRCAFRWEAGLTLAPDSEIVVTASDGSDRRHPILPEAAACADRDGFYVDEPAAAYPLVGCARTCISLRTTHRVALSSACSL